MVGQIRKWSTHAVEARCVSPNSLQLLTEDSLRRPPHVDLFQRVLGGNGRDFVKSLSIRFGEDWHYCDSARHYEDENFDNGADGNGTEAHGNESENSGFRHLERIVLDYIYKHDWSFINLTYLHCTFDIDDAGAWCISLKPRHSASDGPAGSLLDCICTQLPHLRVLRIGSEYDPLENPDYQEYLAFNLSYVLSKPSLKKIWLTRCHLTMHSLSISPLDSLTLVNCRVDLQTFNSIWQSSTDRYGMLLFIDVRESSHCHSLRHLHLEDLCGISFGEVAESLNKTQHRLERLFLLENDEVGSQLFRGINWSRHLAPFPKLRVLQVSGYRLPIKVPVIMATCPEIGLYITDLIHSASLAHEPIIQTKQSVFFIEISNGCHSEIELSGPNVASICGSCYEGTAWSWAEPMFYDWPCRRRFLPDGLAQWKGIEGIELEKD